MFKDSITKSPSAVSASWHSMQCKSKKFSRPLTSILVMFGPTTPFSLNSPGRTIDGLALRMLSVLLEAIFKPISETTPSRCAMAFAASSERVLRPSRCSQSTRSQVTLSGSGWYWASARAIAGESDCRPSSAKPPWCRANIAAADSDKEEMPLSESIPPRCPASADATSSESEVRPSSVRSPLCCARAAAVLTDKVSRVASLPSQFREEAKAAAPFSDSFFNAGIRPPHFGHEASIAAASSEISVKPSRWTKGPKGATCWILRSFTKASRVSSERCVTPFR